MPVRPSELISAAVSRLQQFQKTDRGMVGAEHGTLFSRFFFLGGGGGGVTQDIPMLILATKTVLKQS